MPDRRSCDFDHISKEVHQICQAFLEPCGITYFQFKRIYNDDSYLILANHEKLFKDFLEKSFIEPIFYRGINLRQSNYYFWDELLSPQILALTQEKMGFYHGLTITSRGKTFFDSSSFALSNPHPSPTAHYLQIIKNLQNFLEHFPKRANNLIEKIRHDHRQVLSPKQAQMRKSIFLPKRSRRLRIGTGVNDYITTYEAICVQLLTDGKSYKEIGSILSMAPSTVETHLNRLKERTGLTYQEVSLQILQTNRKSNI